MESSTPFVSSLDVYNWISEFNNLERGKALLTPGFIRSFRLDRMKILAALTGNPENCAPAVHCAGSKGKGSVTGMTAAILNASGKRCSLYASPHVSDFRERLSMGGVFFDEEIYRTSGEELRKTVSRAASGDSEYNLFNKNHEDGEEPTFFELMTLWFFVCSRAARVDAMAIETGIGGRLDATNIIDPLCSVITLIELEHTELLGNTIAAIAGEKAGIIKKSRPVVLADQKDEALSVFKKKAEETGSELFYFPEWGEINGTEVRKDGTFFSFKMKEPKSGKSLLLRDLRLRIPGGIQAQNAGLAMLAAKAAFPELPGEALRNGVESFSLPARFERLPLEQEFVIDGAHTPRSVENAIHTFTALYGKGGVLVFACAAGKDAETIAALCVPWFSKIIVTTPGTFKKSFPEEVYGIFSRLAEKAGVSGTGGKPEIIFIPETEKAFSRALELGESLGLPILGAGSFYLAAELLGAAAKLA